MRTRIGLLSASLVVALLLVEGILQLFSATEFYVWPPNLDQVFRPSPEIMPGVSGDSRFLINELGIRGRSFSETDRFRILTIGGSTTECLYLDQSEAWPHLLQESLNERFDGSPVWVGNVGKSGHNTRHHVLQIEALLDQFPTIDLVISMIGVNDLHQRLVRDRDGRPTDGEGVESNRQLVDQAFAIHPNRNADDPFYKRTKIWRRLRAIRRRLPESRNEQMLQDVTGSVYEKWRRHRRDAPRIRDELPDLSAALQAYSNQVDRIIDLAERRETPIVFVTQPSLWRSDLPEELERLLWLGVVELGRDYYSATAMEEAMRMYNATLLEVCARRAIHCVDLASSLPKDDTVFYDDVHFNEGGASEVAGILSTYLLGSGLIELD